MRFNRTFLVTAATSLALLLLLVIQINWIMDSARIKEKIFSEKANMVLSKTAEALNADKEACEKMELCFGQNDSRKIDSLLQYYMKFYNIDISYYFDVKPASFLSQSSPEPLYTPAAGCYKKCVGNAAGGNGGLELKLVFPGQEDFILGEMGLPFFSSVVLIVLVMVMSWRTIQSLMKEKRISELTIDFLNNMTHEFKTPLTNISLAGKMILRDSNIGNEEKIRHYSGIILDENEKLRLQVEQVLGMSALERGEVPLKKVELDFHQLIRDTLKCVHVQIENRQGTMEIDLRADKFVVNGDKQSLTNAFCNLVDNAVKYSKEIPEITIASNNVAEKLVVEVTDNGIGIEKEYQKNVFDKFFRVPTGDVHDVKGFGLGLAYAKKIIEMHGGTIELLSEPEAGTTFTITLPYA